MSHDYLSQTPFLDYGSKPIQALIAQRGWAELDEGERIGAAYDYVRNEVLFGYNSDDALPASQVLEDGYGQCNTKGTLLMALLRALSIPCRFRGFTINKALQRGVVPELVYPLAPRNIIHSWVEVQYRGEWLELEGFILDQGVLSALQAAFPERSSLCAYGAGTDCLQAPNVAWAGQSTYIQKTGINRDFGVFDSPDAFYANHRQLTGFRGLVHRLFIRHWMNRRVAQIRSGRVPKIPGGDTNLLPAKTIAMEKEAV
ncbi:transglutaminase family protein [Aliiroseovarius sp. F20344]|uniref:transglutaminase-like domain-containing protein n=1 Tax=Aliiroseovarius sp. F20344 TaxID=2926414 RepID=UPI001FF48439|nr:transglutaminase family protein [Aliiroseovarius sp. F20344]MCK0141973.1 transglutaminase family protein [Aliiroseovarius sp. F20344]